MKKVKIRKEEPIVYTDQVSLAKTYLAENEGMVLLLIQKSNKHYAWITLCSSNFLPVASGFQTSRDAIETLLKQGSEGDPDWDITEFETPADLWQYVGKQFK